jgi:hypothetical protein
MAEQEKKDATAPSVTALDGKTTLDGKMFFEPERLAYESTNTIAAAISATVEPLVKDQRPVVITAGEFLADLSNLTAVDAQLTNVVEQYATCKRLGAAINSPTPESLSAAAAGIAGIIGPAVTVLTSAIGLVSLFRENVDLSGVKTDMDQLAFRIVVAARLKVGNITVRLYETELPSPVNASPLLEALKDAENARAEAWEALAPHLAALAEAQAKLDAAARVQNNAAAVDQAAKEVTAKRQKITPVTNLLERADAQLASLRAHLEKVDEKSGMMTLGKLLRAERAKRDNAYILHVGVVAAGGHHRVAHSLFRRRDSVGATGGAVARWAFLDSDGTFLAGAVSDAQLHEKFPEP